MARKNSRGRELSWHKATSNVIEVVNELGLSDVIEFRICVGEAPNNLRLVPTDHPDARDQVWDQAFEGGSTVDDMVW